MNFRAFVIPAALSGLGYRLRLGGVMARFRLSERLAERDRIARELHDTLLQGVQSLILRFQVVADTMPIHEPSRLALENTLTRADELLAESRARIKGLRSTSCAGISLAEALAAEGMQLAAGGDGDFSVSTEGSLRALHPIVREEVLLIGREAIMNAFAHSYATLIEVVLDFREKELRLRVRDNGCGFDFARTADSQDHWGLIGMHERAKKLDGELDISSTRGAGTQIDLRVSASVAYAGTRGVSKAPWRMRRCSSGHSRAESPGSLVAAALLNPTSAPPAPTAGEGCRSPAARGSAPYSTHKAM